MTPSRENRETGAKLSAATGGGRRPASERLSQAVTRAAGTTWAFIAAAALIVGWLVSGPIFHFSDTWQLVINTTTTIVTFLMVFLIQRSQNKDARAMSSKLNELIAVIEGASNRLIDVESLSEEELETIHRHYQQAGPHGQTRSDHHAVPLD
jgi:low affinity Fe/Cu permease